ncbi:DUF3153 domain-containing protein [Prochlorococcus marinus]|uniref:DUF3153 domain-containing protein n=1 Tax=Prochlorococcus marinus TaxID=1219 RepID=UPI0022B3D773|nr:DUF3153 domain-containing protein [Prochlorococcus marinus]
MSRETTLKLAEEALARGSYHECITSLETLLEQDSLLTSNGAKLGILMITALVGTGESSKALSYCKQLTKHKDDSIRQQAKQLLSILASPELERPKSWSIEIPNLNINSLSKNKNYINKQKPKKIEPKAPTGETKDLKIGFTLTTLTILLLLTFLLSGCMRFTTEIQLKGADKLAINWSIKSNSNKILPWQEEFISSIRELTPKLNIETTEEGIQNIYSQSLNSKDANILLKNTLLRASNTAGVEMPPTNMNLQEKNWLIGIQQNLDLNIDLTKFPEIPGLKIEVNINPLSPKSIPKGSPVQPTINDKNINWQLQLGNINKLSIHKWHWSRLGLGTIGIICIMLLSLIIQNIKLQMGFGFPELPP